jgi:hypothetical protein
MEGPAYLLLDDEGAPIAAYQDLSQAMDHAHALAPDGDIYFDGPEPPYLDGTGGAALRDQTDDLADDGRLAANPKTRLPMAQTATGASADAIRKIRSAMERPSGPVLDWATAVSMPLEAAWERLHGFFPTTKYIKKWDDFTEVEAYTSPRKMAKSFLGQNYKTSKTTPPAIVGRLRAQTGLSSAHVLGLSMLPSDVSYDKSEVQEILQRAPGLYGVRDVRPVRLNTCVRATKDCKSGCLVFSGHNLVDDYNTVKKYALLESFVHEPEAFLRLLIEAIEVHRNRSYRADTMPLVRLNVFTDLPWESMVPELFEAYRDVQFYDYTKLPGRITPKNYDITFSFAGTAPNVEAMDSEIRNHGRRVAVVFAATTLRRRKGTPGVLIPKTPTFQRRAPGATKRSRHYVPFPPTFMGLPVVDGDVSDMRPYDPAPVFVGLRWKNPRKQNVTMESAKVFVVKVNIVQLAGGWRGMETDDPRDRSENYAAIVSKSARFDSFDYAATAPSQVDK